MVSVICVYKGRPACGNSWNGRRGSGSFSIPPQSGSKSQVMKCQASSGRAMGNCEGVVPGVGLGHICVRFGVKFTLVDGLLKGYPAQSCSSVHSFGHRRFRLHFEGVCWGDTCYDPQNAEDSSTIICLTHERPFLLRSSSKRILCGGEQTGLSERYNALSR